MAVPRNTAFETALKIHLDTWASDPRSFRDTSTLAEVLHEVQRFEEAHSKTLLRRYADRFSVVIQGFATFFSAVDQFVSSNPQTAGLIWGGLKFVIQVRAIPTIMCY